MQWTEFFVILDHFLPFYPLNKLKRQNFEKMQKNARRYHHFTNAYGKLRSHDVRFLRYGARQTDRRTDGWAEGSDIWRWVPHLKILFLLHSKRNLTDLKYILDFLLSLQSTTYRV